MSNEPAQNTDRELWRKTDEYYSPSLHVTESGGIGINVGGTVIVKPIEEWHALASRPSTPVAAQGQQDWCGAQDKGFTCTELSGHSGDHIARLFDPATLIVISHKIAHQWAGVAASQPTTDKK